MVELHRADRPRRSEVELHAVDRLPADRDRALVGDQSRLGRNAELEPVHRPVSAVEVWVRAEPVRARVVPDVRRLHAHGEAVIGERVLDPQIERERVARSRVQPVLEHGAVRLLLGDRPLRPAGEPVNRVAALGLVERELVALALELVAAVLNPVGPGRKQLPAAGAAHRDDAVAVEHRPFAGVVAAQPAADSHDDHPLVAGRELDLLARGTDRFLHVEEESTSQRPQASSPSDDVPRGAAF